MPPSLAMIVDRDASGRWSVLAPWLSEPVTATSWEEAYWIAIAARRAIR